MPEPSPDSPLESLAGEAAATGVTRFTGGRP